MPPEGKLGVLAGAGTLPKQIIAEAQRQARPVFAVAFNGQTDPATVENIPHRWFRLGSVGGALKAMRREGVSDVVFAGAIRRPSIAEIRPDLYALKFYVKVGLSSLGDDGLLRNLAKLLENEGFRVVAANELVSNLTIEAGSLGKSQPTEAQLGDIAHGFRILAGIGQLDIGQSVIVQQGIVLGVEAAEGTDALIARCATLARKGSQPILVKAAKPQQDTRLDMPTIGVATIDQLAKAGFGGVAIEAGRTIVLDAVSVAASADANGIFVTAFDHNG